VLLSPDPQAFGGALAEIRKSKGLTQKAVADRISTYYSDDSAYRRVERGQRLPDRDAAIAILTAGLGAAVVEQINGILALAGYAPLTEGESRQLRLPVSQPEAVSATPRGNARRSFWTVFVSKSEGRFRPLVVLVSSIAVSVLLAVSSGRAPVVIASTMLYASLYAVSLLLESALDAKRPSRWAVGVVLFCLMLASSVVALTVDTWLAGKGSPVALPLSFAIYLCAAAVQWMIARTALPEIVVVPLQFQAHTAQAAHLKNTLYFLVIVALFWLPPFHCIAELQREVRIGHASWVKALVGRHLILGKDFVALSPEALWFVLLGLALLAVPMAARLLENLKTHPGLNTYTGLLYLRAALYFLLILVCLIWYSSEIASLRLLESTQF
jgi:transcriptional regulator with XRE-family HTH domain